MIIVSAKQARSVLKDPGLTGQKTQNVQPLSAAAADKTGKESKQKKIWTEKDQNVKGIRYKKEKITEWTAGKFLAVHSAVFGV